MDGLENLWCLVQTLELDMCLKNLIGVETFPLLQEHINVQMGIMFSCLLECWFTDLGMNKMAYIS